MIFSKTLERFRNNYLRGRVIFVMDLILSMLASGLSIIIVRAVLSPSAFPKTTMWPYLLTAFVASAALFLLMRTYRIIIRHFTPRDGLPFIHVSVGKVLLILAVVALAGRFSYVLLLTLLLDFSGTLILLIGVRALMIFVYSEMQRRVQEKYQHQRLFIYGTSEKSVATILRLSNSSHYLVAGILKRGAGRENKVLNGVPVVSFSNEEEFRSLAKSYRIDAVLFATDADAKKEDEGVVSYCSRSGIKTLIVPKVSEGLGDNALLRELRMEDILMRDEIVISMDEIRDSLSGSVVMVTGAAGSIGSELVRQLATFGVRRIVLFDNAETPMHNLRLELEDTFPSLSFVPIIGDVRQIARLDFAFRTERPEVVFHAAAYKHVPLMEEN
ncbi:MAG: polysaccharide biosynthesis protein, partial [Bacteroidales bacterium]|nr:polysaccharide biosynthesis protein [Bacteroidales bacterium]